MNTPFATFRSRKAQLLVVVAFLGVAVWMLPLRGQEIVKSKDGSPAKKGDAAAAEVDVRFVDGSTMKLQLRDDKIELETTYGKLLIPVSEVKRIDFGLRIPEETVKRIEASIKDLGNNDFRRREAAASFLLAQKDKAYPALMQAKGKEAEAERRIEELLEKIRETSPAEALEVPPHDVVHTANSRIAGRIKVETFRVTTLPFGDQPVKLADMRTLKIGGFGDMDAGPLAVGGLLEAGMFHMHANQIGKVLSFRVTAPQAQLAAQMGVWGSDVYTTDTSLAAAAVHAGVLRPGETGVVRVTFVGQHPGFLASMRNGVMSNGYGPYSGYRIEQPKNAPKRKE